MKPTGYLTNQPSPSLLVDLGKFMTVLCLFLIGFSMLITAMNTPFYDEKLDAEVRTSQHMIM